MAEFEKLLRRLSAEEIGRTAQYLLEQLSPGSGAERKREAPNEDEKVSESGGKAAETAAEEIIDGAERTLDFLEARAEKRLREAMEALPKGASSQREEYVSIRNSAVRAGEDMEIVPEAYEGFSVRSAARAGGYTAEAEELSDFFRRDSRRYDREFERY